MRFYPLFPFATLLSNLLATLLFGLFSVWAIDRSWIDSPWREFLLIGLIGGLASFSIFTYDSFLLLQQGGIAILLLGLMLLQLGRLLSGL